MRLENQVALITGAGSGIGRAIAERFVRERALVVITDIDRAACERAAAEIDPRGENTLAIHMDVTQEEQVDAAVARTISHWGRLDIAIANAGIQHIAPLHELSLEDWRRVVSVHLDGAFLLTRAALRPMYAQKSGCLMYMGSVHSKLASPLKAPYVAAKHALAGLCRSVAREGAAHGVRSHLICPGFVRTALVERQIPQQAEVLGLSEEEVVCKVMLKDTVTSEFTTLEDVAQVAVDLAEFPSAALTGQSVMVSHGWFMQ